MPELSNRSLELLEFNRHAGIISNKRTKRKSQQHKFYSIRPPGPTPPSPFTAPSNASVKPCVGPRSWPSGHPGAPQPNPPPPFTPSSTASVKPPGDPRPSTPVPPPPAGPGSGGSCTAL